MKISLSSITCGHSCWYAKEVDCKCSCGGKNHGVLKTADGIQPERMRKVGNYTYYLQAVGKRRELIDLIDPLLKIVMKDEKANVGWWKCNPATKGSPFMIQYATYAQAQKWKELTNYKGIDKDEWYFESPALLWRRSDISESLFD